jgi:hypothetical protein
MKNVVSWLAEARTAARTKAIACDFANVIETTQIGGRRLVRLTAGNLSPGSFGLLQHNLPGGDIATTL